MTTGFHFLVSKSLRFKLGSFDSLLTKPIEQLLIVVTVVCNMIGPVMLGCGYVSTSDYLNHIETITVTPVTVEDPDFTYERATGKLYDEVIREALVDRFSQKWRDGSHAQLDIIIRDYAIKAIDYDANNRPIRLQMKLVVDYTFKDQVRSKLIEQNDNYQQVHEFFIVSDRGEPPETLGEAKGRLVEELVDDLYSLLAEQW